VRVREFAVEAARLLDSLHGEQIVLLDVRGLSDMTDYVLIASGTSGRQMRSVAHRVQELATGMGIVRYGVDSDTSPTWVVVDFVDVMMHLFEPSTRSHYDLEMLWGDAKKVNWKKQSARSGRVG
jgi:ribosome-associated protein